MDCACVPRPRAARRLADVGELEHAQRILLTSLACVDDGPLSRLTADLWSATARRGSLGGAARDQLIQAGFARLRTQHTAQPLYVLPHGRAATGDDRHIGVGDIHAFIQYAPGYELAEAA